MKHTFFLPLLILFVSLQSFALVTEIGVSYGYQKKTFNENNYDQNESKAANLSFYFLERMALELSYTDSFSESQESDTTNRVIQQSSKATGADLIYVFADKNALFQPYIKAGTAYIQKKKQIRYINASTIDIPTKDGFAPSYGVGLRIKLSERFSAKMGYDVWRSPQDNGSTTDDTSLKIGMSMYL